VDLTIDQGPPSGGPQEGTPRPMIVHATPATGVTIVVFETPEEHQAVISGLDSDRNHLARHQLYLGLINARAATRRYWLTLAAFGEPNPTPIDVTPPDWRHHRRPDA